MKTFVRIALPLALLIAAPLQAQTTLGVKGGINISTVNTDLPDFENLTDSKTGFVGGVYANFALGGVFAIQPELLYSEKGFKGIGGCIRRAVQGQLLRDPGSAQGPVPDGDDPAGRVRGPGGVVRDLVQAGSVRGRRLCRLRLRL